MKAKDVPAYIAAHTAYKQEVVERVMLNPRMLVANGITNNSEVPQTVVDAVIALVNHGKTTGDWKPFVRARQRVSAIVRRRFRCN